MYYRGHDFTLEGGRLGFTHGEGIVMPKMGFIGISQISLLSLMGVRNNIVWMGAGSHNFSPFERTSIA